MKKSIAKRINFLKKISEKKIESIYSVEEWKPILKKIAQTAMNNFMRGDNPEPYFLEGNKYFRNCVISYCIYDKNEMPAIVFAFPNPDEFRGCLYKVGDGPKRLGLVKRLLKDAAASYSPPIPLEDFQFQFGGQISEFKVPLFYDILVICQPIGMGN